MSESKDSYSNNFSSTGPVMTRMEFNKSFKNMKSLHKTSTSYKPTVSKPSFSKIDAKKCELNVVNLNLQSKKPEE